MLRAQAKHNAKLEEAIHATIASCKQEQAAALAAAEQAWAADKAKALADAAAAAALDKSAALEDMRTRTIAENAAAILEERAAGDRCVAVCCAAFGLSTYRYC